MSVKVVKVLFWIITLSIIIFGLVKISYSQERVFGQDYLALQYARFNETSALAFLQNNISLGTLDTTFGTDLTPITNLLNSGKFVYLRTHLLNGTCVSNQNCGKYEPLYGYTNKTLEAAIQKKNKKILTYLTARAKTYCSLRTSYPALTLILSPVLEHHLSTSSFRIVADAVLAGCPGVQLANNSFNGKGERYAGAWRESHDGFKLPAEIVSFDGLDSTDANIQLWKERTSGGKISFIWTRSYNCRTSGGGFVDPRKRTACPSVKTFELVAHLTDDRGAPVSPSFSAKFKPYSAPAIWKVLSEDYPGVSDPRANLPCAILPLASGNLNIRGVKGTTVGVFKYFSSYAGLKGYNRYYSGTGSKLSGYELEKAAQAADGSPYTYACQSGVCYGPLIGGQRNGAFR